MPQPSLKPTMDPRTNPISSNLKYMLGFACIACFLAMSWEQLGEFLSRQTNVSREWQGVETRKMPLIAFCPKDPFVEDAGNIDMYTLRLDPEMFEAS